MTKFVSTLVGRLIFSWFMVLCFGVMVVFPLYARTNLKVSRINFTGNLRIPEKSLKPLLKSREGKPFNPRFLKLDEILLKNYYHLNGFLDVFVHASFTKKANRVTISYEIREGIRYYLKELRFTGNTLLSDAQIRSFFNIRDGDVFKRPAIDEGLNKTEAFYQNRGKPYVLFSESKTVVNDSLISLTIFVSEGQTVRIAEIIYTGMKLVKRFLLRREMEIKTGDLYSREKIEASQRNLYTTGLFSSVNYRVVPLPADPSKVKLVWILTEKKPMWIGLRFGVSYESGEYIGNVTTFDFTAEGGHRNLFGTARSISLKFVPSVYFGRTLGNPKRRLINPRNEYSFTYVEPWLLNTRTPGIVNISYSQQEPPVSREKLQIFSTSFRIHHKFKNAWAYTAALSFQKVSTPSDSILNVISQGQDLIYALTVVPLKDRRDNLLMPQRGSLTEFRNRFVYSTSPATVMGRDTLFTNIFYKLVFQWSRYQAFKFQRKWVLASRFRIGGIIELNGRQPIRQLPITELFYLGGTSTVRGYAEQSIGGRYSNGIPIGGKYVLLGNVELRIPLFWLLMAEVFTDAGNLWQGVEDIRSFSLKIGSGAGLAIVTPFGPIRFDYGVKWFRQTINGKKESPGEFHVGISFAF